MSADTKRLLAEYVEQGSETAFRELVHRYLDLVYSAAARLVEGDTHLAQDVAQTVFADLARMAHTLHKEVMLGGWLHRHTCFVASKMMRGKRRRESLERRTVEMNAQEDHSKANLAEVAFILDQAINKLGVRDREAIVLRFFEQRDLRAVGQALGGSEDSAQKRVARALEKLHAYFIHHGVSFSAAALGTALATEAVATAPAGLAVTISTAALSQSAATGSTIGVLKWIAAAKLKTGLLSAVLVAGVASSLMIHYKAQAKMRERQDSFLQESNRWAQLTAKNERLAARTDRNGDGRPNNLSDLLRLRREVGLLRNQTNELATLLLQNHRLQQNSPKTALQVRENQVEKSIALMNYTKAWIVAFREYANQNGDKLPNSFDQAFSLFPDDAKNETNLRTDQFEIVYQGSLSTVTNPANVMVIREKQAWSDPDGLSWARACGFVDGHSEIHLIRGVSNAVQAAVADRSFDAWDKAHMILSK